jgi:hypothetical protein
MALYRTNKMRDEKKTIVDEHFWFTLTTMGVNGFLISINPNTINPTLVKIASLIISLYAAFLIIHRSAAHAGKLEEFKNKWLPKKAEKEK